MTQDRGTSDPTHLGSQTNPPHLDHVWPCTHTFPSSPAPSRPTLVAGTWSNHAEQRLIEVLIG